jgi:S-adenosylmethionine hydrolase
MTKSSLVALLTDFGTADSYVAEMKAAMIFLNPALHIVDITHSIPPGDIRRAAYLLWRSHVWFPHGSIFLSVVDPGVGSDRRIALLQTDEHLFVAPDNGLLTMIATEHEFLAWEVLSSEPASGTVSETFHGRDIMAPLCAQLSSGRVTPSDCGPPLDRLVKFRIPELKITRHSIEGEVICVDRFGNAVTNIPAERAAELGDANGITASVGQEIICPLRRTFSSVDSGQAVAYIGSAGLVELAINRGDFAGRYAVKPGSRVRIAYDKT